MNNDGWHDLYLALSAVLPDEPPANPLFLNKCDGTFASSSSSSGLNHMDRTLGVAYADCDNDGWVDLVIGDYDRGYVLYHNEASVGKGYHRLAIELVGVGPVNRDTIGARVYLTTNTVQTQMQEVKNGSSLFWKCTDSIFRVRSSESKKFDRRLARRHLARTYKFAIRPQVYYPIPN